MLQRGSPTGNHCNGALQIMHTYLDFVNMIGMCQLPARTGLQCSFQYRAPRRSSPKGMMRTAAGRADAPESVSVTLGSAASISS